MEILHDFLRQIYSLDELIRWGGYIVLFAIVFSETGLFFGFFLPGDSLLVTAGLFAAKGDLNIFFLQTLLSFAAIIGDSLGYYIGAKTGRRIFHKEKSFLFAKDYLLRTKEFYEKHGGKTIILARFMPIIRTFAPVVAGVGEMEYIRFVFYNIFGGIGWVMSMTLAGYFLGSIIPNIDEHIHIVIAIVIFLSILPGIIELIKARRRERSSALE